MRGFLHTVIFGHPWPSQTACIKINPTDLSARVFKSFVHPSAIWSSQKIRRGRCSSRPRFSRHDPVTYYYLVYTPTRPGTRVLVVNPQKNFTIYVRVCVQPHIIVLLSYIILCYKAVRAAHNGIRSKSRHWECRQFEMKTSRKSRAVGRVNEWWWHWLTFCKNNNIIWRTWGSVEGERRWLGHGLVVLR